ncbi:Protein LST8 [Thelohanellus kitauei]|uniref:Target of rapamycin complex subunit lst8 n=1 Tax=Thelohanellus kitauei TaxID=669202 RepID=A0A0C2IUZ5_THEKT|nr:Protein LST8 [Thelohanellus kitauei]
MKNNESSAFLLTGGYDCIIKLWRVQTASVIKNYTFEDQIVNCINLGFSKTFFYAGGFQSIRKYDKDASSYPILVYDNFPKNINCLKSNSSENWLVSAGEDGFVRIWDLRINKISQVKKNCESPQFSCAIHQNEIVIYSCGLDGNVHVWDIRQQAHKSIGIVGWHNFFWQITCISLSSRSRACITPGFQLLCYMTLFIVLQRGELPRTKRLPPRQLYHHPLFPPTPHCTASPPLFHPV